MSDNESVLPSNMREPIAESPPIGRRLRTEEGVDPELRNLLDKAREARTLERTAENNGEDPSIAGISEWQVVKEQATHILANVSKDIEVAAALVEALVRTDGFLGLGSGIELLGGLVSDSWPDLVTRATNSPDDDADEIVSSLVRPIDQLNAVLPVPLARLPLTDGGDAGSYALWQYDQAGQNMTPEERERRKAITQDQFARSVKLTAAAKPRYFSDLAAVIRRSIEAAESAERALDEKVPVGQAPSLSPVRERLDDVIRCLKNTASAYLEVPAAAAGNGAPGATAAAGGVGGAGTGELVTREQAFQELSRIADFFARTEPLSLLAEQIREVVRRGHLTADKYYKELIDNEDTLKQFFRLVGIRASEAESSSDS